MNNMIKALICLVLGGCNPPPDGPMQSQTNNAKGIAVNESARATVTRIGVFEDDIAYNRKRGVYLIRDEQAKKEYIGVSGIGISEIGSHLQNVGKVTINRQDER